ncbi:carboxylesterase/lipase family protein [Sphingomonas sp. 3-13AW]|uniref:carboxylesterase/lipase family protein n=1 Tax=Sphingomonas sp. 3-13AW TaxID=3050450 RepID=UPI003BB77002
MRILLRLGALACAALPTISAATAGPIVRAPAGAVEGSRSGKTDVFRGIPFAAPPVGPLRWKAPAAFPDWQGVRKAERFGDACVQPRPKVASIYANPPERMSEDCLVLNVWAPRNARKLPVVVWIHGGALSGGYGHERYVEGARMAEQGGVVVITINYRLGVLGYLAHESLSAETPEGTSGNYGLLDQIAALRWVQRNIGAFGGDPDNVTIAGESAGALSVMYLMAAPPARGLFHKAIAQSAYMISTPELRSARHGAPSAEAEGARVMAALGAPDIAALRAIPAEDVLEKATAAGYAPWGTIDGKLLPRQLVETFDRGEQAPVPLLAGFNSGEIRSLRFLLPPAPASAADYEKTIRSRYGDLSDAFLQLYPSSNVAESMLATTRDALYGWTATRLMIKQTAVRQPAYLYYFDHGYPAAQENGLHGFHAAEIPYVFGTAADTPPAWPKIPDTAAERRFSRAMMQYWTSFARSGTPVAEGQPAWPAYGDGAHYMAFGNKPRPGTYLLPNMYALHEAAMCRRRAAGDQPWNWNTGIVSPVLAKAAACR